MKKLVAIRQTNKKEKALLLCMLAILGMGFFYRIHQLSVIPASISYDELDHVVNGAAVRHTFKDFQGQNYIWELLPTKTHTYTAELSSLWHAITPNLFSNTLTIARFPNFFFGLISAFALSYLIYIIFKSKLIALLTLAGLIISPWHIFISRTAFEAPIALSWMMLAILLLWLSLSSTRLSKKIILGILTIVSLFFSFYNYHGYKFIYPLLFIVIFFWQKSTTSYPSTSETKKQNSNNRVLIFLIIICWIFMFSLFYKRLSAGYYGERTSEISFLNTDELSSQVNIKRRDSLDNELKPLVINKATIAIENISRNFFESIDPKLLFFSGFDGSYVIGLWEHGFLYAFQLPLLFVGLYWLIKNEPKHAFYLSLLAFLSLLPTLIHTSSSISLRSSLYIPIIIIYSSIGLYAILKTEFKLKVLAISLIIFFIFINLINFGHFYFYRFPIQTIDTSFFKERLAVAYILHYPKESKVTLITGNAFNSARIYALFSKSINSKSIVDWQELLSDPTKTTYKWENITFTTRCEEISMHINEIIVADSAHLDYSGCDLLSEYKLNITDPAITEEKVIFLPSPRDNRDYYQVYNDNLCTNYNPPKFISIRSSNLFAVEELSSEDFCNNWTRYELLKFEHNLDNNIN
ncbi:MAG: hypothetical protein XD98_0109 [Microgenomates bacterium 39_6]|nr:MAG: hypothetical protein XD98_0109 [Microgenomates bacterium 39_6]